MDTGQADMGNRQGGPGKVGQKASTRVKCNIWLTGFIRAMQHQWHFFLSCYSTWQKITRIAATSNPVSPRRHGGHSPPKQSFKPPQIETWNTINQIEILVIFRVSRPSQQRKAALLKISGDSSESSVLQTLTLRLSVFTVLKIRRNYASALTCCYNFCSSLFVLPANCIFASCEGDFYSIHCSKQCFFASQTTQWQWSNTRLFKRMQSWFSIRSWATSGQSYIKRSPAFASRKNNKPAPRVLGVGRIFSKRGPIAGIFRGGATMMKYHFTYSIPIEKKFFY